MTADETLPPILDVARRYVAAGLSVIPIRADGSKSPAIGKWGPFEERPPTDDELRQWFAPDKPVGVAVVCGMVSGNLAVLDFETNDAWNSWLDEVIGTPAQSIIPGCPLVVTPGGGRHLYCRIPDGWVAGGVLARRDDKRVAIEIRGQGNYVVAPGSPAACHKTNKPYTFTQKGWLKGV